MGHYFKHQIAKDPEFDVGETDWTVNIPWVVANGRAAIDGSQVGEVILQQTGGLKAAVLNKVYLNVNKMTAGNLNVLFGTADIADITESGTYTVEGTPLTNTNLILTADADCDCEITQVFIKPLMPVS